MTTSAEDSRLPSPIAVSTISVGNTSQGASVLCTPPILRLPVELLGMIFTRCNKNDDSPDTRPNVRLVCKDFECIAAPMLAQDWSGCLNLELNKYNMDGLTQICPVFASHLKTIRLCTQRLIKITNKPHLGQRTIETKRWSPELYDEKQAWLKEHISSHNLDAETQHKYFMAGAPLKSLVQALQRLMGYQHTHVALGTYNSLAGSIRGLKSRLLEFHINDAHVIHDASSTLQILSSAVHLSGYPVQNINLQLVDHYVQVSTIETAEIFWAGLPSITGFSSEIQPAYPTYLSVLAPSLPSIAVSRSNGWHLKIEYHYVVPEGRESWPYPSFGKANYGAFYEHVRSKDFSSVTMTEVWGTHDFLELSLNIQPHTVERLELSHVTFSKETDDFQRPEASLKFLPYLKTFVKLQSLVLEKILDASIPNVKYLIQEEKVMWDGQTEIQAGLDDLIVKAKAQFP